MVNWHINSKGWALAGEEVLMKEGGLEGGGGGKQFTFLKYNGYIFKWDSNKVFKILRIYAQIIKAYQLKLKIY